MSVLEILLEKELTAKELFTNTSKGGAWWKKGVLKILKVLRGPWKNHANFAPENWVYMIFCGIDAYNPWGKEALKFFVVKPPPPLQVFVNGPLQSKDLILIRLLILTCKNLHYYN